MVYKIMPASYKAKLKDMMVYTGSDRKPDGFVNYAFAFSLAGGAVLGLLVPEAFIIAALVGFISIFLLLHGFLSLAIERRANFVEEVLPDTLQLMAANSRAGYIPSRALLLSARKEFGPLSEAIKKVGKEIVTGKSLEESLKLMTRNIRSDTLERTVRLISEGIRNGGQFASLLEENAHEIRLQQGLKKEVSANVMMYVIFIAFAGCMGAPALYAISGFLIKTITELGSMVSVTELPSVSNVPMIKLGTVSISENFLYWFSLASIFLTSMFGSLIIGMISSGKTKSGIKYAPVLVILAFLIYFVAKIVAEGIFAGFS